MRVTIISTLASMGRLQDVRTMLNKIHMASTVAWNVVISSYAQSGLEGEVLSLYNKDMRMQGKARGVLVRGRRSRGRFGRDG
jgi:pentatricopeptide repeat protein